MAESKSISMLAIWQLAMKTVSARYLSKQTGWGCPEDHSLEAPSGSQKLGIPWNFGTSPLPIFSKFNEKPCNQDLPNLPSSGHPWIPCWYHRSAWPRRVAAWPTRHGMAQLDIPREQPQAWGNKAASAMNPGTRDLNRNYLDRRSQHKHWSMVIICIILYR